MYLRKTLLLLSVSVFVCLASQAQQVLDSLHAIYQKRADTGYFNDTLVLKNNQSVYTGNGDYNNCKIIYTFFRQGINVKQVPVKPGFMDCGFGNGVMPDGFFSRTSSKIPADKELTGE